MPSGIRSRALAIEVTVPDELERPHGADLGQLLVEGHLREQAPTRWSVGSAASGSRSISVGLV
jgi:hypothetical protein